MRAVRTLYVPSLIAGLVCCLLSGIAACESDAPAPTRSLGDRLSDRVSLKIGMLIESGLPDPTDGSVSLVDLGPAVILQPESVELLGFEVSDPEDRDVVATLLQFEGASSHIRAEIEEQGNLIENELNATGELCDGLCDGVLTVTARIAVELEDGAISEPTDVDLAIDCRGNDDQAACEGADGDANPTELVCGDVTRGETALTGDAELDAYFDALRMLASFAEQSGDDARNEIGRLVNALEASSDSAADIASALQDSFAQNTDGGVMVLWGDAGCGVRAPRTLHTLRACDPEGTSEQAPTMACSGVCEQATECESDAITGCRGFLDNASCAGECVGACQAALAEPVACAGTCIGVCDGECPGETDGQCAGPCAGVCDGECRSLHGGACDGTCTGLCDERFIDGEPSACDAMLRGYCDSSEAGRGLLCTGDCYGTPSLSEGTAICQASAIAEGQLAAECQSPIVQLAFGFASDATATQQEDFAQLIGVINAPITSLLGTLAQLDQIEAAAAGLLTAAEGPVAERLQDDGAGALSDEAQQCADDTRETATGWLSDQVTDLAALRADILEITGTLTTLQAP